MWRLVEEQLGQNIAAVLAVGTVVTGLVVRLWVMSGRGGRRRG